MSNLNLVSNKIPLKIKEDSLFFFNLYPIIADLPKRYNRRIFSICVLYLPVLMEFKASKRVMI